MYGIFTYIWSSFMVDVGIRYKYIIHAMSRVKLISCVDVHDNFGPCDRNYCEITEITS